MFQFFALVFLFNWIGLSLFPVVSWFFVVVGMAVISSRAEERRDKCCNADGKDEVVKAKCEEKWKGRKCRIASRKNHNEVVCAHTKDW